MNLLYRLDAWTHRLVGHTQKAVGLIPIAGWRGVRTTCDCGTTWTVVR